MTLMLHWFHLFVTILLSLVLIKKLISRKLCNMGNQENETKERYEDNNGSKEEMIIDCKSTPIRKKTATKTKEFKFATDSRINKSPKQSYDSEKPFASKLRQNLTSPNYNNRPTLPSPFKFMLPKKLFFVRDNWESLAEAALKFQTKTPPRFVKCSSDQDETIVAEKPRPTKIITTIPVSPKLLTKERTCRKKIESAKDIEEKEIEKMKSFQFKAREINPKMVEMKGMYGVKEIPASSYTEVKSFHFQLDRRIEHRKRSDEGKHQVEKNHNGERKSSDASKHGKLTPTKVKAFSFEIRDKERYTKKEEKIKSYRLAEEKLHEFHARSLPSFSNVLPPVPAKRTTKPQPFKLSEGSPSYHSKLEEKLKLEEEEEKARRQFKARSADVVKKEPFHPITGTTSPTNTVNITLHSELRAKQRAEFEYTKEEKERSKAEEVSKLEKEKQLEEEEQMKILRKTIVHKANPIRAFKSLEILPSNVPVTVPKAPSLQVEKRAKSRISCSQTFSAAY